MSAPSGSASASSGGIGTASALGVAFVVLKLCGVIDWSWWWVTAPFWAPLAVVTLLASLLGLGWLALVVVGRIASRRRVRARRRRNLQGARS